MTGETGHVTSSMKCRCISSTASNVSYAYSTSLVAVFLSLYDHVKSFHAARLLHASDQGNHTHFTGWVPDISVQYCKQACMTLQGPSEQGCPFSFRQPSITMNWSMCLLASLLPHNVCMHATHALSTCCAVVYRDYSSVKMFIVQVSKAKEAHHLHG